MSAPYATLLWDFDGTLADTLDLSVQVYNALAPRYGFRPIEDARAARDLATLDFMKAYRISPSRMPSFVRKFLALQKERIAGVALFAGVADVLRALRGRGCRLGVLSSNSEENIRACLRANRVEDLFEVVAGYARLLGKARAIRRVVRSGAVPLSAVLYVGDEVRDVEAARKAGVDVAAVTWGFNSRQLLAGHAPTYLVTIPAGLLELVR